MAADLVGIPACCQAEPIARTKAGPCQWSQFDTIGPGTGAWQDNTKITLNFALIYNLSGGIKKL